MPKRFFSLVLALLMALPLAACKSENEAAPDAPSTPEVPETEKIDPSKIIDIYLIAGQSNAVGHTKFFGSPYESYLNEFAPELAEGGSGFSHIHYAGNSRKDINNYSEMVNQDRPWQKISLGLGSNANNIGPEVGMAKALSKYYNAQSGRSAGIIKFGHGGTSLQDGRTKSNAFGNWVAPSYAEKLGVSYKDTDVTGALYRGLLEQVKRNISELYEYGGYEQINIRGLYWMQGESDRNSPDKYETAFKCFVSDLRRDLSALMLEFTGGKSDLGASEMGIFIGSLSRGYNVTQPYDEYSVNIPFINMQKKLAEDIENCYFVDNSKYAITKWNSEKNEVEVLGTDKHHWNAKDMLNIGNNVGKMMFDECVRNGNVK